MALHNQLLKLTSLLQELESSIDEYNTLKEISDDPVTVDSDSDISHTFEQFLALFSNISSNLQDRLKGPISARRANQQLASDEPLDEFTELKKIINTMKHLIEKVPEFSKISSSLDMVEIDNICENRKAKLQNMMTTTRDHMQDYSVPSTSDSSSSQNSQSYSLLQKGSRTKSLHKKSVRFKDHLIDGVSDKPLDTNLRPYRDHVEKYGQVGKNRKADSDNLRYHDEPIVDDDNSMSMSDRDVFIANQQQMLEQNRSLDHLSDSVQRQHEMSLQINDEVSDHMVLLDDLENGIDRTNARLMREKEKKHVSHDLLSQPTKPVRSRFAPSPTGFLHLGSLRTALYNYLIARSTHGQFILRLEDTDQKRLVEGAEENIYHTLEWLGLSVDEGPQNCGTYAPYKQSERTAIYSKYIKKLLDKGLAYRCFCTKGRLTQLRDSARLLKPPTTASYDRYCLKHYSKEESDEKASAGEHFTVRFVSPHKYPAFIDLLHGKIDQQIQINPLDVRYEDPVLLKSDGLPTYHFANVIDDHLMKITHVIRGEEWLASTPKHVALYDAFGWNPPKFIHIPLLTTVDNRKLSKRSGDIDIMSLKSKGFLPEALINFSVLFGWSPRREYGKKSSEIYSLKELEKIFTLEGLTRGECEDSLDYHLVDRVLQSVGTALSNINELNTEKYWYFFVRPKYTLVTLLQHTIQDKDTVKVIVNELNEKAADLISEKLSDTIKAIAKSHSGLKRKTVYQTLRYALSGPQSGISMHTIIDILGLYEVKQRLQNLADFVS
ncbi:hypothetical protein HII12_003614 [Brettanomyces bruxellensis]|uniref:Glutamate--tRNA ligase, mitochondrial n=1 Tax=Dekkera bruxellensis TaxID=5007 RepID=A0A8H6BDW2_DEKBR|nr:hypothetical protein HII12_003614 [Brettanomyces bruxellensis]